MLAVLALVCAGLIVAVVFKTRDDASTAAREAAQYTPPALTSSSGAVARGATIAVIGDESASRAAAGVAAARRWPELVASGLGGQVDLQALSGGGYTTRAGSATFVSAAAKVPTDSRFVLFVGGAVDVDVSALTLARAATQAFAATTKQAPDATVIVVGPLYRSSGESEAAFAELRTTLRSAARIAGVRWVDPIAADWVRSTAAPSDLTDAPERAIASRLRNEMRSAAT